MLTPAGEFNKSHGIKGEISASFDPRVDVGALKCVVAEVNGLFVPFFIDAIRSRGADAVLLTIDGITDENEAKLLSRKPLYLLNGDAALAADDEDDGFYAEDLVGFSALDEDGAVIGKIAGVDSTTANVLFVIDRPDGSEALVPVADEFIDGIDPESATITLRLPDGLL
jgi:16S rRNA processing protein rimM